MKKTRTVKVGGRVFHLDEDAYALLDRYLRSLRGHFEKEEGGEEILLDFEGRIAELFVGRTRLGYDVMGMTEVEEVIRKMGKPEEICGEQPVEGKDDTWKGEKRRRFYRDTSDKILGGVASGFAAYMGWDTTAVRLAFIVLAFTQVMIPLYLILWLIVPQAKTAAEKLQMRGEQVTPETIGRMVTERWDEEGRTALHRVGDAIVRIVGGVMKVLGVIVGIVVVLPLGFVLVVLFGVLLAVSAGLAGSGAEALLHFLPWWPSDMFLPGGMAAVCIGGILATGIPLYAIGYAVGRKLFGWKEVSKGVKWTLVGLWALSLIILTFCCTPITGDLLRGAHQ
jgi:phage shock protein PspC (stress-responsive transcriptional regulator)